MGSHSTGEKKKKKKVQGGGKRGLKGGNNEIVNPKEREMPRVRQKKKIVSKTCLDVDVIWLTWGQNQGDQGDQGET